jgi:chemotaxis protein CheX
MQHPILQLVNEATSESVGPLIDAPIDMPTTSHRQERCTLGEVTAIVELNDTESLLLSFDIDGIHYLCERMLGESCEELTEEVLSTVGEVANIIVGALKRKVELLNIRYKMARPVVLQGKGIRFSLVSPCKLTTLGFSLERGKMFVEVTVEDEVEEAVLVI